MASTIPISNTNIVTLLGIESAFGVVATVGKQIAYEQNTLVRNQALEKNSELRGNRQMGTRVPGNKNPSGTILGHQTDVLLPLSYYAMLGSISTTEVGGLAVSLTTATGAATGVTFPDAGAHTYCVIISKGGSGTTKRALHGALNVVAQTITPDGAHKVNVTLVGGPLPTGWTWALYRTKVGGDPTDVTDYFEITPALALAANVTSYADDQADASLGTAMPTASDTGYGDYKHIIIPGDTLPSLSIERKHPYVNDAAAYFVALGSVVNKGSVKITGTGYYDIGLDYLFGSLDGPNASSFDGTPDDWRFGEKIHHAMALAAKVKLDGSAFAKFQDLTISHMNNLDTSDYPVGGQGDRGSLVPLQAETTVSGSLKVTDPDSITLAQDTSVLHTLSIQHDFATFGHYIKHDLYGVQFDPTDPAPSGQGILKYTANGAASQPLGGNQIVIEVVNGTAGDQYTGS
jgi:hypothetical protein